MVGIAQLVRAPDCGSGGQEFDSLYSPHFFFGVSPSGKARDFDFRTRRFKSCHPSQMLYHITFILSIGVSPSGKATDSDSVIREFKSLHPSQ